MLSPHEGGNRTYSSGPGTVDRAAPPAVAGLDIAPPIRILKRVLNQSPSLDLMFAALADPSRRRMVDRLSRGPASVKELAQPLTMSLPAVLQHLQVLENSGLVRSEKAGRVRTCRLETAALSAAEQWISERRRGWERRLDRLDAYLKEEEDE
jgi:DNA-binding transcriptional ArsR family regulator